MISQNAKQLMALLIKSAEKFVESNTTIKLSGITEEMCNRAIIAIKHMKEAVQQQNIGLFNKYLVHLYSAIPRIPVSESFLELSEEKLNSRYEWESTFVDNINGARNAILNNQKTAQITEEEKLMNDRGISIEEVSEEEVDKIKKMMGKDSYKFIKAWKVCNERRNAAFEEYCTKRNITNRMIMWHGSPTCNFLSILSNGLSFSKVRDGMFGKGFYFAPPPFFGKSRGYTSVNNSYWRHGEDSFALLGLFEVAVGKPYNVYSYNGQKHANGFDSLWAHSGHGSGLLHDEVVTYNENAMSIKYIVKTQ